MKKIINVILLFFTLNIYSQDTLKWNFKYSGYVDLKTIKLPSGGQIINLFNITQCIMMRHIMFSFIVI